ncbi:MAG: cytochrome P450 [Burkholderiaceae bacterium]|nr:MAG: cytochrome P450 [Burkholderiaceae bacterium]
MTTPDMRLDPYPHYAKMRATAPVFFNPERQVWEVYGYHDIQTVLGDPVTFSSEIHSAAMKSKMQTMGTMDPPRHTQLRKLISRAFTTKTVAALEPRIHRVTNELLDRAASIGQMDIITDFAFLLPITVIAELLGVPLSDQDKFKRWSDALVQILELAFQGQAPKPHLLEAVDEIMQYLEAVVAERQRQPSDDLISGLITANVDGEHLTLQEITSTCRGLLIAGHETTANLIGNAMHLLLEHPDSLARLRAEPELLPSAIEEVLRYRTPSQFFARIANRDIELGEQLIRAGQRVVVFNGSGNRDAAAFPDPDRFDITRSPNRHLSFGYGIHFCLGAGLGRVEAKIAINALLQRFPDIQLDAMKTVEPLSSKVLFGLRHLPVRFTPTVVQS